MQTVSKLSKLQKRILAEGLKAVWDAPVRRAWGREDEDSFGIAQILKDFFELDKKLIHRRYRRNQWALADNRQARRQLASPRAAVSRAIARLVWRSLLEKTGRGRWRLSLRGVAVAQGFCSKE